NIYNITTYELIDRIEMTSEYRLGRVCSVEVEGLNASKICYLIYRDGKETMDEYATKIVGRDKWNDKSRSNIKYKVYSAIATDNFEFSNKNPAIAPKDMIIYKLHMRGYTMQHGLNRWDKGNYKGFLKCLDEIEDLGVTTIEFQPIYEFEEMGLVESTIVDEHFQTENVVKDTGKINYWGYDSGHFFAPKASYFGGENASENMKKMIDELHGRGLEIIMEIAFDKTVSEDVMISSLIFWVKEYHVDGLHILGNNIPIAKIVRSPYLADTKLFYHEYPYDLLEGEKYGKHIFISNDEFLYALRALQNHFDGYIAELANNTKRQNENYGFVNYAAASNGFTLFDSFAYGEKHNEDNGEENRDGNNYNCSNNYGYEGKTNNRAINTIRLNNIKTAICAVMLGQAIPLILAGDEVGNSQMGNNNVYCQDNKVGWVDFPKTKFSKEIREFTKEMIKFRKDNPIIRLEEPMHMNDYHHTGIPDLSYHGREPWMMGIGDEKKALGVLYTGEYSQDDNKDDVLICYNFHYEAERFALPRMPGNKKWYKACNSLGHFEELKYIKSQHYIMVPGGSITILVGKETKLTEEGAEILTGNKSRGKR
ncbi:MAG: glycogen operon protein GlgX, partial [Lachnospiraceae bacterium]|nr:glycogen operon protein GlgX [Lachnospiraceae bacterium]